MTRISASEFKAMASPKQSKYRNVKVTVDGIRFDSKREASRWKLLKLREAQGEISHLERQPVFKFMIRDKPVKYPSGRQISYKADFAYFEDGVRVVEDAKGFKTKEYKIKKALVEAMYPAVRIVEV